MHGERLLSRVTRQDLRSTTRRSEQHGAHAELLQGGHRSRYQGRLSGARIAVENKNYREILVDKVI